MPRLRLPTLIKIKLEREWFVMKNELIRVVEQDGKQLVSARELHEFLGSKKHMTQWIKSYVSNENEYGFVEGIDYQRIYPNVNPLG